MLFAITNRPLILGQDTISLQFCGGKQFAPNGILIPTDNIFNNHKCKPAYVSFTFKTDNVVVISEGGQVLSQILTVNRRLQYGHDIDDDKKCSPGGTGFPIAKMIAGHTLYGKTTTRRTKDDGEAVQTIKFDNDDGDNNEEVSEMELEILQGH